MTEPVKMTLTAHQLATVLVLDGAMAALQTGANQLGSFLKLQDEANILVGAINYIGTRKQDLQAQWERRVQLVGAEELGPVINGKVLR